MSEPIQKCKLCGRAEVVKRDGRGFPPDIAKRKLQKACKAAGCSCQPEYTAGFGFSGPVVGMTAEGLG